ncbi:MAG TPA: Spy/CpxP family protein refolding chaperone [Methylocella sp.]|nr:Spy/CpxP family protein refolding chaperone [Methylocella sp.]
MKPSLPIALTMIALVGSGVAFTTFAGSADPVTPPAPTQQHEFSPADRAAFLDARIAALHAGLTLTPEQEKLWPVLETALRTAGKSALERMQKFKSEPETTSLVDRLRERGENAVARGQSLEAIANAAAPLYATLSDEQKHRLPVLMHGLRPHFHRFAFLDGGHQGGWRHEGWGGHEGFAPQDGTRSGPKDH